ncbi:hypothetical protein B296_00010976 [Ensete ventricosum]|uniref:Uncharacterized protein n=1 Tax=Ensete ventricosum TaxID=4639 RepID=A0A427ACD5_ENSVE|nr:hypothetical protein B296_00010976 [Ensete ventricosum]
MISSRTEQYTEFAGKHWVELYERLLLWTTNAPEFAYQQQDSPRGIVIWPPISKLMRLLCVFVFLIFFLLLFLWRLQASPQEKFVAEVSPPRVEKARPPPAPPAAPLSGSPRGQCEDARPAFVMPHGSRPRWVSFSRVPVFDLSGDDDSLSAVSGG